DAPALDIAGNQVRLEGLDYRMTLRLQGEHDRNAIAAGTLTLRAVPGRSFPPTVIHGARGWLSGYVVPVLEGPITGALDVEGEPLPLADLVGYHDHNWGFWKDVRWQWGQVADRDVSIVYGRVFPPSSVADPDRVPGFL